MRLTYRPEIDGLRAIAVSAVILYHAQINFFEIHPFKGGLIGVDIFFVISGYLISKIIFKELIATNNLSLKKFFERRIRRILPALFFVMIVSIPFAWVYLIPSGFVDYSKSIIYSLLFGSNFYFHYSGQIYGAVDGFFKPFLHTWSLSIEEQFYFFFPLSLIIAFKFFKKYLIYILLLGFLISFGFAVWNSIHFQSISFYFIHSRIWELLAGSILAYFEISLGHKSKSKTLNLILPKIGILLICYFILFYNQSIKHPSFHTLLPITGTCLIIWFSDKKEIITKTLSTRLFVGVGVISYSLYLWHYPIFSFLRINGMVSNSITGKLLLIPIIILLSVCSYYFIERPFRNRNFSIRKVCILLIICFFSLLIINLNIIKNEGFKKRFNNFKKINQNFDPDNFFLGQSKLESLKSSFSDYNKQNYNIIVIGDSHGLDLFNALYLNRKLFKDTNFFYIEDVFEYGLSGHEKYIKNSDMIIISYRWINNTYELLKNNFEKIYDLNKNIVITSSSNEYKTHSKLYTLLDYKVLFEKNFVDYFGLKNFYFNNRIINSNSDINKKLYKFASEKKLKYLNKEDYMCETLKKECDYIDKNGFKIFYDYGHYTKHGAKYFGKKIHEIDWLKLK